MAPRGPGRIQRNRPRRQRKGSRRDRGRDYEVAALALAAAIVTAVLGGWAAWLSAQADGGWHTALREELKWSAAAVEDIRFVYTDQAPDILGVDLADARAAALRRVAADSSGLPGEVAMAEARAELELAFRTRRRLGLSPEQERAYRRPDGSFDLERLLADERSLHPDLVGLDPEREQAAGDHASRQAGWVAAASLPVAGAFVLAAMARRRHRRWRRLLLGSGYGLLGVAALVAFGGVLV
jgi:hypothetical protein